VGSGVLTVWVSIQVKSTTTRVVRREWTSPGYGDSPARQSLTLRRDESFTQKVE